MALNNIILKVVQHGILLTEHKFSLAFGTQGVEAVGNKYGCPIDVITAHQTLEASLDETDEGSVLSSLIDPIKDRDAQRIFLCAGFSVESSILTIWVRIPTTVPSITRTPIQPTPGPVSTTPQATIAAPHSICKTPASGSSKKPRLPSFASTAVRSMVDRVVPRDAYGLMLRGPRQDALTKKIDARPPWVNEVLFSLFNSDPMTSGGDLDELMNFAQRCATTCL